MLYNSCINTTKGGQDEKLRCFNQDSGLGLSNLKNP
nr:MAG TPA: hypothetical protein [Caudoviricetes sp.]